MTKNEKRKFIRDLTASIRRDALNAVARMPENWDGIELRQYLADKFEASCAHGASYKRRLKDYRNEVLVQNL